MDGWVRVCCHPARTHDPTSAPWLLFLLLAVPHACMQTGDVVYLRLASAINPHVASALLPASLHNTLSHVSASLAKVQAELESFMQIGGHTSALPAALLQRQQRLALEVGPDGQAGGHACRPRLALQPLTACMCVLFKQANPAVLPWLAACCVCCRQQTCSS